MPNLESVLAFETVSVISTEILIPREVSLFCHGELWATVRIGQAMLGGHDRLAGYSVVVHTMPER